jgi:hypothetical protein
MTIRMIHRRLTDAPFPSRSDLWNADVPCEDAVVISHWDEPETEQAEVGHRTNRWTNFAAPTEARRICVNRIRIRDD